MGQSIGNALSHNTTYVPNDRWAHRLSAETTAAGASRLLQQQLQTGPVTLSRSAI